MLLNFHYNLSINKYFTITTYMLEYVCARNLVVRRDNSRHYIFFLQDIFALNTQSRVPDYIFKTNTKISALIFFSAFPNAGKLKF